MLDFIAGDANGPGGKRTRVTAANGLLDLASKVVIERGALQGRTTTSTTIGIEQMEGSVFPAQVGKKFSYVTREVITDGKTNDSYSVERSCEYVDRMDAAELHPRLSGPAYVLRCKTRRTAGDGIENLLFIEAWGFVLNKVDRQSQSESLLQADGKTFALVKLRGYSTTH
jgi:hypothetical protein